MATEFRLCDEDHKQFAPEGAPEWVVFDRDALDEITFDVQHPWEREIKRQYPEMSIVLLVALEFPTFSALGIKAMVWLAWKMNGIETPPWKDFNIKHMKVARRLVDAEAEPDDEDGEDTDPPADGSTEPSSEQTESSSS